MMVSQLPGIFRPGLWSKTSSVATLLCLIWKISKYVLCNHTLTSRCILCTFTRSLKVWRFHSYLYHHLRDHRNVDKSLKKEKKFLRSWVIRYTWNGNSIRYQNIRLFLDCLAANDRGGVIPGMAEWRNGPFSRGGMRNETQIFGGVRYEKMRFLAEWRNGAKRSWRNGGMEQKLSAEWRNGDPWETPLFSFLVGNHFSGHAVFPTTSIY